MLDQDGKAWDNNFGRMIAAGRHSGSALPPLMVITVLISNPDHVRLVSECIGGLITVTYNGYHWLTLSPPEWDDSASSHGHVTSTSRSPQLPILLLLNPCNSLGKTRPKTAHSLSLTNSTRHNVAPWRPTGTQHGKKRARYDLI